MLLYRIGYMNEDKTEEEALDMMRSAISWAVDLTQATSSEMFLSCPRDKSFRAVMYPEYKANRKPDKPKHFQALKELLLQEYKAIVPEDEEADDLIGIEQTKDPDGTICCTVDKDILYGVIGNKFKFTTGEKFYTSQDEATLFFYKQLLMGDTSDNIKGVEGIGVAKANKILNDYLGYPEAELFKIVRRVYENKYGGIVDDKILLTGRLLKIRTRAGELWQFPSE